MTSRPKNTDLAPIETPEGSDELSPTEEPIVAKIVDEDAPVTVNDIVDGAKDLVGGVATSTRRFVDRGRYRKLRVTRKGKQILPDIPLAAVAAIEAASVAGAGVARVLAVNVGARFLFDVEVVNEADKYLEIGRQALLDGDLENAKVALQKAVRIDDTHAESLLQLGILHRLKGDLEDARYCLEQVLQHDELGDAGKRAKEILRSMAAHG